MNQEGAKKRLQVTFIGDWSGAQVNDLQVIFRLALGRVFNLAQTGLEFVETRSASTHTVTFDLTKIERVQDVQGASVGKVVGYDDAFLSVEVLIKGIVRNFRVPFGMFGFMQRDNLLRLRITMPNLVLLQESPEITAAYYGLPASVEMSTPRRAE